MNPVHTEVRDPAVSNELPIDATSLLPFRRKNVHTGSYSHLYFIRGNQRLCHLITKTRPSVTVPSSAVVVEASATIRSAAAQQDETSVPEQELDNQRALVLRDDVASTAQAESTHGGSVDSASAIPASMMPYSQTVQDKRSRSFNAQNNIPQASTTTEESRFPHTTTLADATTLMPLDLSEETGLQPSEDVQLTVSAQTWLEEHRVALGDFAVMVATRITAQPTDLAAGSNLVHAALQVLRSHEQNIEEVIDEIIFTFGSHRRVDDD